MSHIIIFFNKVTNGAAILVTNGGYCLPISHCILDMLNADRSVIFVILHLREINTVTIYYIVSITITHSYKKTSNYQILSNFLNICDIIKIYTNYKQIQSEFTCNRYSNNRLVVYYMYLVL